MSITRTWVCVGPALLANLERRGLIDETVVVWAGEFGRTPMEQGKGGRVIGATDEIGLRAAVDPHPVKDLHATILTAVGLCPDELSFGNNRRPKRLTGVAGSSKVISGVLA